MKIRPLSVPGGFVIEPDPLEDNRGRFYETFRHSAITEAIGRPFRLAQLNFSVSRRGVLRGLHGVLIPPGQAKIVTCQRGALLDVVVDIRVGSTTFGRHELNRLDAESGKSLYIAEGLGHGFLSLAEDTCISYLCSTEYVPGTQLDINALDPALGIDWPLPDGGPIISQKDAAAPTIAEAAERGLLPSYAECLELYARH